MTDPILYFAYGSNLNKGQMARRCPGAEPIAPLSLPGMRLTFRRVADIEPCAEGHVAGALWLLTPKCRSALDRYEGVKTKLYFRDYFTVRITGGALAGDHKVLTYIMSDRDYVCPPPAHYLNGIIEGYEDFGLDFATLDSALSRVERIAVHA